MTTKHIYVERDDRGAPVWLQMPWELQRYAVWLFATFTLTFAMMQPTPARWLAVAIAYGIVVVHSLVGPDDRKDRCGL